MNKETYHNQFIDEEEEPHDGCAIPTALAIMILIAAGIGASIFLTIKHLSTWL